MKRKNYSRRLDQQDEGFVAMKQQRNMDPTGISEAALAIGAIASVASVGASAYGAMQQRSAANQAAQYNAQVLNDQAATATAEGNVAEANSRLQTKQLLATQQAGYAGGGVDVNSGSSLLVGSQTAGYGELDALTAKSNAQQAAWGYSTQAQATLASQINPVNAGVTSLLASGGQVGGSLLNFGLNRLPATTVKPTGTS